MAEKEAPGKAETSSGHPADKRAERLAAALRANLKRRKSQSRERSGTSTNADKQPSEG